MTQIDRRPLTSVEQTELNALWPTLWRSDTQAIEAATQTVKREGFDAVHRTAYAMAMRTKPMPREYWPASREREAQS
jgi:hypothetical protein